jgi:hypothetical protein
MGSADKHLLAVCGINLLFVMLHCFKCSQQPHVEYKIGLKEIFDDWYKKTVSRCICRLSRFFMPFCVVHQFSAVFIIRHAISQCICYLSRCYTHDVFASSLKLCRMR